jgi:hypothetical protein
MGCQISLNKLCLTHFQSCHFIYALGGCQIPINKLCPAHFGSCLFASSGCQISLSKLCLAHVWSCLSLPMNFSIKAWSVIRSWIALCNFSCFSCFVTKMLVNLFHMLCYKLNCIVQFFMFFMFCNQNNIS